MPNTLNGKTCLVTGASTGIGRETALALAREGATVVIVSRDQTRGAEALASIKQQSGNDKVELLLADLSSMAAVRKLAAEFRAKHDKLHVLVNNAGVVNTERKVTADGYEATFALNHLGYFLLTEELLDLLKASAPARIVNVSSDGHRQGHINFDDLQCEKKFSGIRSYCQSKLANVVFTYELAKRLEGTGVTANALHPGVVASRFGAETSGWFSWGVRLMRPFMITPEQGAATSVYLATSPEVAGVTGKYFAKKKARKTIAESNDPAVQKRLWEVSEQLTRPR
jgi:NAD(P)-dependent dehydrogenase (short-subunit alcohol dehydrogenase family)